MKMYTNEIQTAKLIELGFAPKMRIKGVCTKYGTVNVEHEAYFGVGELIEMLPENSSRLIRYVATKRAWIINVDVLGKQGRCHKSVYYAELIDVLYDMIIKLKEGGVI